MARLAGVLVFVVLEVALVVSQMPACSVSSPNIIGKLMFSVAAIYSANLGTGFTIRVDRVAVTLFELVNAVSRARGIFAISLFMKNADFNLSIDTAKLFPDFRMVMMMMQSLLMTLCGPTLFLKFIL